MKYLVDLKEGDWIITLDLESGLCQAEKVIDCKKEYHDRHMDCYPEVNRSSYILSGHIQKYGSDEIIYKENIFDTKVMVGLRRLTFEKKNNNTFVFIYEGYNDMLKGLSITQNQGLFDVSNPENQRLFDYVESDYISNKVDDGYLKQIDERLNTLLMSLSKDEKMRLAELINEQVQKATN